MKKAIYKTSTRLMKILVLILMGYLVFLVGGQTIPLGRFVPIRSFM